MSNFMNNFLNNLLPPAACPLCGADSWHTALCPSCSTALPWLGDLHCPCCALPTLDGKTCGQCLTSPPAYDHICAAFLYRGTMAELITAAKFGTQWFLLPALARMLLDKVAHLEKPDCLIALPLHPQRLKERGFNQAQEIALTLAKTLQIPLAAHMLSRSRNTEHQARLSEKARHRNMRGAFMANPAASAKHIVLVDDVMTTGASLDAAARALKKAGARRVDAWVLARTP